jgi:hypothetical protein
MSIFSGRCQMSKNEEAFTTRMVSACCHVAVEWTCVRLSAGTFVFHGRESPWQPGRRRQRGIYWQVAGKLFSTSSWGQHDAPSHLPVRRVDDGVFARLHMDAVDANWKHGIVAGGSWYWLWTLLCIEVLKCHWCWIDCSQYTHCWRRRLWRWGVYTWSSSQSTANMHS